jgi:hypothetical protein
MGIVHGLRGAQEVFLGDWNGEGWSPFASGPPTLDIFSTFSLSSWFSSQILQWARLPHETAQIRRLEQAARARKEQERDVIKR